MLLINPPIHDGSDGVISAESVIACKMSQHQCNTSKFLVILTQKRTVLSDSQLHSLKIGMKNHPTVSYNTLPTLMIQANCLTSMFLHCNHSCNQLVWMPSRECLRRFKYEKASLYELRGCLTSIILSR